QSYCQARSNAIPLPLLRRKLEDMALTVQARRVEGFAAALDLVKTNDGEYLSRKLEQSLAAMTVAAQGTLAEHLGDIDSGSAWVRWLMGAGAALALLTMLWATWMLYTVATTDALTGLLSRNQIWELFSARNGGAYSKMAAMLFVDIDRFRSVNQVFGPARGDALLAQIGRRLKRIARGHHVGRLGGDDFAICGIGISASEAEELGIAAAAIIARPFTIDGRSLHLTASIGVAHVDTSGDVDLRQGADDAMYVAKSRGGNQAVAFVPSMHDSRKEQAELEEHLHFALDSEAEFSVVYQPVVGIASGKLIALEALARWTHPLLGPIPPLCFIELAERRGLIIPLGLKLMSVVVRQAAIWHARYPGRCPVININISPSQFATGDVIADLVKLLLLHNLPPSSFCIELTERAFADTHALRALKDAQQLGFKVAMDDFGIGYSSLSQLPRLPLSSIKLDRSFICNASQSPGDAAILIAIVQLAHTLKLDVTAEGVESPEQLKLVAEGGCDAVQGYVYSRPLSVEALAPLMSGESALLPKPPEDESRASFCTAAPTPALPA
ncbi:EAL domain-containing protein, partial [Xanthobacter sp. DSM 24535]|uniref:EAL domain-containing protein n=1 Tax=Roseixanthobacter psychrophilus TaxID=3119917 RepID=UPI00372C4CB4